MEENNNMEVNNVPQKAPNEVSKWWMLLSALICLFLGFYFYRQPGSAVLTSIYYIAFAKIISGIGGLAISFNKNIETRKWNAVISIIDLLFGLFLLSSPYFFVTFTAMLPFVLAAWAFSRGILLIIASFKSKSENDKWWISLISGIVTFIAGIIIFQNPFVSLLEIMQITGIFMIIMGGAAFIQFIAILFTKKK